MLREITFDSKKIPAFLDGAINAMALYKQTGIINKFDKCTVTAPIDYTTTGYGTITFNDGAIVVCGRVVYIEAGTTLAVPITTTAGGSIGVKVDLNQNAGSQVAFYSKTTQTLTQQDLNENKTDGIYEFEIFKYTSNGTTLVLTYQTASIFDANETIIAGIKADILTYAKRDGSNLTADDKDDFQNEFGFERVDLIYDKSSANSNINWGKSSGILGGESVASKDFSKYKVLECFVIAGTAEFSFLLDLEFINPTSSAYLAQGCGISVNYARFFCKAIVNSAKTSFTNNFMGYVANTTSTFTLNNGTSDSYIYKIKGRY